MNGARRVANKNLTLRAVAQILMCGLFDTVTALPGAGPSGKVTLLGTPPPEAFIRIKCHLHPWEFACIGVVGPPFFPVTGTNGAFWLPRAQAVWPTLRLLLE